MALVCCIISLLSSLVGFAAFITFLLITNYYVAVWGLLTGVSSAILAHLHNLSHRQKLSEWYSDDDLTCLSLAGFIFFATSTAGFVFHVAMECMGKMPVLPVQQSQVLPAIWCFITMKSGLMLFFYARRCRTEPGYTRETLIVEDAQ